MFSQKISQLSELPLSHFTTLPGFKTEVEAIAFASAYGIEVDNGKVRMLLASFVLSSLYGGRKKTSLLLN